ncbi:unnamed protein product [Cylicocyclus nassatus]|uniref:Uncharacterized protein n=1 Tax=Cylicocyclus nassatus TaxID=53992 RepID=A0AA36M823_CYLNA|nr:unnamed protein product [Cylicocyclus nassatus]
MASTIRSLKGLVTKRNEAALQWLQESSQVPQSEGETWVWERDADTCQRNIDLLEKSLLNLTKAFDEATETTDEEEDRLDKYIERTHATIMKLHAHRSSLENRISSTYRTSSETDKEIWDRYWSLESTGTEEFTGTQQTELQKINEKVLQDFKESIEKREDGYYVRLPWKEDHPDLPDNKALALKRLEKVLEIYQNDTETLNAYDKTFKDQLEKGVIEESSEEALAKYTHTKTLFRELNMNLREYRSNDQQFNTTIAEADRMKSICPKVLGIPWNSETDKFIIRGSMVASKEKITKRTVTQQLASIYDPMGFIVPLLLPAKIFLQSLWKEELDWDTPLTAPLQDQWRQISSEISTFYKEISRQIIRKPNTARLVVFTDASQWAMAACAYLTTEEESNLIMGKSKLPSIKTAMTIPKLEMNAATLDLRLAWFICKELESIYRINEVICYTDSDKVLAWIKAPPTRQSAGVLVTNRLAEMRRINKDLKNQNVTCFFGHVTTSENPADCGSRGLTAEALQNHQWWKGPHFINKPDYTKLTTIAEEGKTTSALVELSRESPESMRLRVTLYREIAKPFYRRKKGSHSKDHSGTESNLKGAEHHGSRDA